MVSEQQKQNMDGMGFNKEREIPQMQSTSYLQEGPGNTNGWKLIPCGGTTQGDRQKDPKQKPFFVSKKGVRGKTGLGENWRFKFKFRGTKKKNERRITHHLTPIRIRVVWLD